MALRLYLDSTSEIYLIHYRTYAFLSVPAFAAAQFIVRSLARCAQKLLSVLNLRKSC